MKATLALALALFLITASAPRRADAALSFAASGGSAGLIVGGLLIASLGALSGVDALERDSAQHLAEGAAAGILIALGLVLLDDESPSTLQFVPLSDTLAEKYSLSEDEKTSYNESVEEMNGIADQIGVDMAVTGKQSTDFARAEWLEYEKSLSPITQAALSKISAFSLMHQ